MKVVVSNRRARFEYDITDTLEAGIILTGQEVKSCRMGHVDMAGAYLSFTGGFPVLKQFKIMPYKFASGLDGYEPAHDRRLLLSKAELGKLHAMIAEKGISVIPLEVRAGKYIKILLGVGRGQKRIDKRRKIKEKDVARRLKRGDEL